MNGTRGGLAAAICAAMMVGAAACSGPEPAPATDAHDALRRDLDAAHAAATARPAERTQFVSALELGRAGAAKQDAAPRTAPRAPTPRAATRATPARSVARPVARVVRAAPAPAARSEAEWADDAEAAGRAPVGDPAPEPVRDEPVVAAPSRPAEPTPPPPRRGRVWSTDDVIRNAPFPINP